MDGYIRVSEAAKRLGVSARTITRWMHRGSFGDFIKNDPEAETGSFYLIPVEGIEAFEKKRKTSPVKTKISRTST